VGWNSGMVSSVSHCLSFFPERLHCCDIDFHCSYLYTYCNSSRTLCIKCWDSASRTEFQHPILRFNKISLLFADTTKRRVRGWKEAQRQGEDRVSLRIITRIISSTKGRAFQKARHPLPLGISLFETPGLFVQFFPVALDRYPPGIKGRNF
jgi:hypothetical protein